jgi:hypothetical protein
MKTRFRFLCCTCALLIAGSASTAGTADGHSQKASPTCFAGFPQGVFHGSPYQVTTAQIALFLTASYTFKDPSLAHENMPGLLVADMNPVSPAVQFAVVDGSAGNFSIHLNVFQDATQDHYGMTAIVNGPPKINFNGYDSRSNRRAVLSIYAAGAIRHRIEVDSGYRRKNRKLPGERLDV